jgi:hypothetical protein
MPLDYPRGETEKLRASMVYIWIRKTGNWHDEEAFRAQLPPPLRPTVAVWDETFDMPYHRFRARVYEIAQASLAAVRGARVAEWEEIPDGALVLPVDDDDWFAPHAAEVLEREHRPGAAAYVWPAEFAETPMWYGHRIYLARRRLLPAMPPKFSCFTNSYAMRKSDETRELLRMHDKASIWVDRAPDGLVRHLDDRLSMMNRTLASQTQLSAPDRKTTPTRSVLVRKYRRYRRLYRRFDASRTPWARPYLDGMGELMEELSLR